MRSTLVGLRVVGRNEDPGGIGEYYIDDQSVGDVIGSFLWKPASRGTRRALPAWRFVWPVVSQKGEGGRTAIRGIRRAAEESECPEAPEPDFLPIRTLSRPGGVIGRQDDQGRWLSDERFEPLALNQPKNSERRAIWQKFPADYYGLAIAANDESKQQELFLPTDPRLISVNRQSDPDFGSRVHDMEEGGEFKIDPEFHAPLQSALRVVDVESFDLALEGKTPKEGLQLAYQLSNSECDDVGGGLAFDKLQNSVYGGLSVNFGGPLDVGTTSDKHSIGEAKDGNKINAMHLSTDTIFRVNQEAPEGVEIEGFFHRDFPAGIFEKVTPPDFDGPLKFDRIFMGAGLGSERTEVFLEYDKDLEYAFVNDKTLKGMWRWVATSDTGDSSESSDVPDSAKEPGPGIIFGGDRPPIILREGLESVHPNVARQLSEDDFLRPAPEPDPDQPIVPVVGGVPREQRHFTTSLREFSVPGLLFRPQFFDDSCVDLRNWRRPPLGLIASAKTLTPIVARFEGFGKQGDSDWNYTRTPEDGTRYRFPSADGGIALVHPELSMEDLASKQFDGTAVSKPWLLIPPYGRLGFGPPDLVRGQVAEGGFVLKAPDDPDPSSEEGLLVGRVASGGSIETKARFVGDNFAFGSSANFGAGVGVIYVQNRTTAPTGNPTFGGLLYSEGGALHCRTSAGNEIELLDDRLTFNHGGDDVLIREGSGSPEGAVTAPVGSFYLRNDGGAGTSFYVKESGVGDTGWVAE